MFEKCIKPKIKSSIINTIDTSSVENQNEEKYSLILNSNSSSTLNLSLSNSSLSLIKESYSSTSTREDPYEFVVDFSNNENKFFQFNVLTEVNEFNQNKKNIIFTKNEYLFDSKGTIEFTNFPISFPVVSLINDISMRGFEKVMNDIVKKEGNYKKFKDVKIFITTKKCKKIDYSEKKLAKILLKDFFKESKKHIKDVEKEDLLFDCLYK